MYKAMENVPVGPLFNIYENNQDTHGYNQQFIHPMLKKQTI
jgi:hypothetical protein